MKTKLLILSFIGLNFAVATDLSGQYFCNGYDSKGGAYSNYTLTLTQVKAHSYPNKDLYSYEAVYKNTNGAVTYSGSATSIGGNMAIYFENVNKTTPKTRSDKGVGMTKVYDSLERDNKGQFQHKTMLSTFYFETTFTSDGSELCKRVS
jgi:hypothetical protein